MNLIPIRLTLNLRNTRRIHEVVQKHYSGHAVEAIGPEGVEVKWIEAETRKALLRRTTEYVTRLVTGEKVPADDIAVLVSKEKEVEEFAPNGRIGGISASRCDETHNGSVIVDSVRRFKGLERPVVILAATSDSVQNDELVYVATSRARTHLAVAGSKEAMEIVRG